MYHVTGSEQVASSLPMTTSIKKACVCVCTGCSQPELSRSLAGVTDWSGPLAVATSLKIAVVVLYAGVCTGC